MPKDTFYNLSEEKRNKIIDSIISEFENNSYENASINRIIKSAGISKGSLYQYFNDKKDLYRYVINLILEEKMKYITPVMENPDKHDFFTLIRDMYKSGLEFAENNPRYLNIGNVLLFDVNSPLYQEIVKGNIGKSNEIFEYLIQQGINRGEIRENINIKLIAHLISDMNVSIVEYYRKNISKDWDEEIFTVLYELLDFLKRGIGNNVDIEKENT
ncbi:MAG: TetR/AcrR family transcriptional regulator [Bacillota bacterium]|nr:TetR/AcrR family transcriptional regulator [Bacillota bacterium]